MNVSRQGPNPPLPEPFWVRSWRTLFRWRTACYQCRETLGDRAAFDAHYLSEHTL